MDNEQAKFKYEVDKHRLGKIKTGIFIRAALDGKWGSYDIGDLDKSSLEAWLTSRGGNNRWAENVVLALLGHGLK